VDAPKSSAPYSEHVEAAREIAGRTYVEDLRRISPAAQATLSQEL
jgi:hypothetical protein